MSETHRITVDPGQCGGRPCLRGLRIRVKDVLDLLAAGASREEILNDFRRAAGSDQIVGVNKMAGHRLPRGFAGRPRIFGDSEDYGGAGGASRLVPATTELCYGDQGYGEVLARRA